jgi:hypothetical protein
MRAIVYNRAAVTKPANNVLAAYFHMLFFEIWPRNRPNKNNRNMQIAIAI